MNGTTTKVPEYHLVSHESRFLFLKSNDAARLKLLNGYRHQTWIEFVLDRPCQSCAGRHCMMITLAAVADLSEKICNETDSSTHL